MIAAFGLVRGLGLATATLTAGGSGAPDLNPAALGGAAALLGQSMLALAFAGWALEGAMRKGLVKPMP